MHRAGPDCDIISEMITKFPDQEVIFRRKSHSTFH